MNYTRLFDLLKHQLENYPRKDAINGKENGEWRHYSTQECIEISNQASLGLLAMGVQKDDKIALIANNRPEWNFMDIGILQIGAQDVPIFPTISMDDYEYIFNEAEVKYCFISDQDLYNRISPLLSKVESLQKIFSFDKLDGAPYWKEVLEAADDKYQGELDMRMAAVKPDDIATLIYTSGTTGLPKGVMLTHDNIVSNIKATLANLPITNQHSVLSFLPICHSLERMVTYTYITIGAGLYYAESLESIGDDLKDVKPHFFTSVPRLLEKVFDKIVAKGNQLTGTKKKLFFWALDLGLKYELSGKSIWYKFQLMLANLIIFSKWRAALGGNIMGIVTGAAALQPKLARVFTAAKVPVKEGYGLTETSPVISFNRFNKKDTRFGTVGTVIPGVEVKLAADGEILTRGPNVMKGYFKKPDETKQVLDSEGWFSTGDIGIWEDNRFLKIIDRKKELYKTSSGKYVAPQPLENKFKESPLIEQIMVVGNNYKFVSALIVPSIDNLKAYCEENGIEFESEEEMLGDPGVHAGYQAILNEFNPAFSNTEQIKKFKLLANEWTVEGGELTPTMKVKRKIILHKYASEIADIYNV